MYKESSTFSVLQMTSTLFVCDILSKNVVDISRLNSKLPEAVATERKGERHNGWLPL